MYGAAANLYPSLPTGQPIYAPQGHVQPTPQLATLQLPPDAPVPFAVAQPIGHPQGVVPQGLAPQGVVPQGMAPPPTGGSLYPSPVPVNGSKPAVYYQSAQAHDAAHGAVHGAVQLAQHNAANGPLPNLAQAHGAAYGAAQLAPHDATHGPLPNLPDLATIRPAAYAVMAAQPEGPAPVAGVLIGTSPAEPPAVPPGHRPRATEEGCLMQGWMMKDPVRDPPLLPAACCLLPDAGVDDEGPAIAACCLLPAACCLIQDWMMKDPVRDPPLLPAACCLLPAA